VNWPSSIAILAKAEASSCDTSPDSIRNSTAIVEKTIANEIQTLPSHPCSAVDFSRALRAIDKRAVDEKEVKEDRIDEQ